MSSIYRKSLLAGALAALVAVPMGAAADSYTEGQTKHQMRSQMGASGQVQSMTPSQLRGTQVVDASGEQIGSVKTVVRSRQDENIHAVISAGGFLGVGDKEITVPLNRMRYEDGKLRLSAGADELRARPEYRPEQYVELRPMDQPISEFSALETVPDKSAPYRGQGTSWDSERSADPNAPYPEGWRVSP
ncbi:PRC-barrel domain-containing protein [Aromatoleum anaerobium]|uniref:PRC-barrel domain-containing protein n=1 Tax=Aromatoleum anaerobium TaxID=182180 RepID=A0ABX1PFY7_9RHOO|nr:PRC-barrel domain-containing protein [Aromatoleum anaerobium]MCK0507611.1 PRC-barrel domain-containing protein [Aromatoleum anaerobium]